MLRGTESGSGASVSTGAWANDHVASSSRRDKTRHARDRTYFRIEDTSSTFADLAAAESAEGVSAGGVGAEQSTNDQPGIPAASHGREGRQWLLRRWCRDWKIG